MKFPADARYSREHEWARFDGDDVVVGITPYAAEQLGDVVFVELPDEGLHVDVMDEFGTVESVKAVSPLYAPVAGEVIAVNGELEGAPELVNSSPFHEGWLIRVRPDDAATAIEDLLDAEAYDAFVDELLA